jgi:signal transduction histidine kinase
VFELAYRADPPRSSGGGGVGLAIAKGIVEAHHGQITASNQDRGCRFVVELPRVHPVGGNVDGDKVFLRLAGDDRSAR